MASASKHFSCAAALNRLVTDPDFETLNRRVEHPNIFAALGVERTEIKHSNFLAWLLDPLGTHGQGTLFLKNVLSGIFKQSRKSERDVALSPELLTDRALREVRVDREWRNVDILITSRRFAVVIENKLDAAEHGDQLTRYKRRVRDYIGRDGIQCVFLTKRGDTPSDRDWHVCSYDTIVQSLSRARSMIRGAAKKDVKIMLDHYLRTIGEVVLNNRDLEKTKLCRRIYRDHRQAVEALFEVRETDNQKAMARFEALVMRSRLGCNVERGDNNRVVVVPKSWTQRLPKIGSNQNQSPRSWLQIQLVRDGDGHWLVVRTVGVSNRSVRDKIIVTLLADRYDFGFKKWSQKKLRSLESVMLWRTENAVEHDIGRNADTESIANRAIAELKSLLKRLRDVPKALSQCRAASDGNVPIAAAPKRVRSEPRLGGRKSRSVRLATSIRERAPA